jgi:NAD(P)-dependent dehydrogenase (short-subunit alcohol dehydrogenase family)
MAEKNVAVVAGVGVGLGKAIAQRFAKAGFDTVIASRNKKTLDQIAGDIGGGKGTVHVVPTDLCEPDAVTALFEEADKIGTLGVAVFNAGPFHMQPLLEIEPKTFEDILRINCFAGFLVGQAAARRMVPNHKGTIIFTGATASLRGGAQFAAFAAAKAGLRSLAQSMARSLGPQGIHVAHIVNDGVIDMPENWEQMRDYMESLPPQGIMKPDSIAESYFALHQQEQTAWTFELDLRPGVESF